MDRMFKAIVVSSAMLSLSACVTQNFEENNKPVVLNESSDNEIALTRISLGLGYLKMGNTSQAKFNLEKAKKYAPNNVQVYTAFAHYYESVGEDNLTIESYEKALSIKPDDADTLNNYGVFLCRKERLDEAETQFLKAIEIPTYLRVSESYENLALCQLEALNFEKTELYLGKAIAHSPSDGSVLYHMMRFQYAIGEYKTAQTYGKRFEKSSRRFTAEYLALAYKVFVKQNNMRTATNYATMLVKMHPNSWYAKQYLLNGLDSIDADDLAEQYQILVASKSDPVIPKKVVVLSPARKAPVSLSKNRKKPATKTSSTSAQHQNQLSGEPTGNARAVTQATPLLKNSVSFDAPSPKQASQLATDVNSSKRTAKKTKRRVVLKAPRSQIMQTSKAVVNKVESASVETTDTLMAQISADSDFDYKIPESMDETSVLHDVDGSDDDLLNDSELDAIIAEAEALLTEEDNALINGESQVVVKKEAESSLSKRHQALIAQQKTETEQAAIAQKKQVEQKQVDNVAEEKTAQIAEKLTQAAQIKSADEQQVANEGNLLTQVESEHQLPDATVQQIERSAAIEDEVVYTSFEQLPQHKLVYGENLFTLSKQYNIHLHALKKWNNLSESPVLQVGDIIYLADPSMIVTETE